MTDQQKTDENWLGDWMVKRTIQALRMIENGADADQINKALGETFTRKMKLLNMASGQPSGRWDDSFFREAIRKSQDDLKPYMT